MGHFVQRNRIVKICDNLCAVGHSAGIGYEPWAIAQDFVLRYGPLRRILLCALGHRAGFYYALWAIAQDLVRCYGP